MQKNIRMLPFYSYFLFIIAWEQRKIDDFSKEKYGGGTPKTLVEEYWNGNIDWIQSSDLTHHKVFDVIARKHVTKEGIKKSATKLVPANSIAIVTRVGFGKLTFMPNEYATSQDFLSLSSLNFESKFSVYSLFNKLQNELNAVQGTSIKGITKEELLNKNIMVPIDNDEQTKIGAFFKQLDDIIALNNRKYDALKQLKSGYLAQIFSQNLRFSGFLEDWEVRRLGELAERITKKNKKLKSTLALTISAQEGLIDQTDFFNKTVASRDLSGYYLVKHGNFAYNKSYSNGYPWGAIKRLNRYSMGVLSTLYIVFEPVNIDSNFLEKYYDSNFWYREISKHAAEGARNHGLLNITASDFFETELMVPNSFEEQDKIGSFLKQLDLLITQQQNKVNALKEIKQAYLQKIFI